MKILFCLFIFFLLSQKSFSQYLNPIKNREQLNSIIQTFTQKKDTIISALVEFRDFGKPAAIEESRFLKQKGLVNRNLDLGTSLYFAFSADSVVLGAPIILNEDQFEILRSLQQKAKLCIKAKLFSTKKYYDDGRGPFFVIEDFALKK